MTGDGIGPVVSQCAAPSDAWRHKSIEAYRANGRHPATAYNSAMPLRPYRDILPTLGARAYVDPAATVIGDVVLDEDVSIWPGTVVRGDVNFIRIGARTNVQDGSVVHVSHDGPHAKLGGFATVIGADVTIGHKAIVHACRIEEAVLIGMGAVVLDGAVVRKHGFVGAGALIAPGKEVGEGELWLGNPARKVRVLSDAEIEALYYSAAHYVRLKDEYLAGAAS
jgi:carbonic anhydrase/acetyltransferase-like protein (isoleucine patch superfamily)